MKKFAAVIAFIMAFVIGIGVFSAADEPKVVRAETEQAVRTAAMKTRFANMLNHNFVYNEDFNSADEIAEQSILSLLDSREDDFILESKLRSFVYNMYGVTLGEIKQHIASPTKEGYVHILPRGYTLYNHKIESVTQNEDGTYTVVSKVTLSSHDNCHDAHTAVSLFVRNENSSFGYNLLGSDIVTESEAV